MRIYNNTTNFNRTGLSFGRHQNYGPRANFETYDNEIRRIGLIFQDNIYSKVSLIRANWDSVNLCPIINPNNSLIVSGNVERHLAHLFSNFNYLFFAQFIWKKAGIDLKFFRIIEIKIHVLQKTRESEKVPG